MGPSPSSPSPESLESTFLVKLQSLPYNSKRASIKEVQNTEEWKDWLSTVQPRQLVDLLLGRDDYVSQQLKTFHVACGFLGLLELLKPNSEIGRKKKKKDKMELDLTLMQANYYLILNKYLTCPKLLRVTLGMKKDQMERDGGKRVNVGERKGGYRGSAGRRRIWREMEGNGGKWREMEGNGG
jgi:hypothetical protein